MEIRLWCSGLLWNMIEIKNKYDCQKISLTTTWRRRKRRKYLLVRASIWQTILQKNLWCSIISSHAIIQRELRRSYHCYLNSLSLKDKSNLFFFGKLQADNDKSIKFCTTKTWHWGSLHHWITLIIRSNLYNVRSGKSVSDRRFYIPLFCYS